MVHIITRGKEKHMFEKNRSYEERTSLNMVPPRKYIVD